MNHLVANPLCVVKAIDFRLRPPLRGFVTSHAYANPVQRNAYTRMAGFEPSPSASTKSLDLLLAEMEEAEVEKGVVVGRWSGSGGDVSNADVEAIVASTPQRFVGAASIDPSSTTKACSDITEAVRKGFKLINIEPGVYPARMHVDDRRLYPVYAHCEAIEIPIILLAGGTAGPDLSYSDPIKTDRILCDFPRLKVVLVHGGWPWVHQVLHLAFRRPNLYLSPDFYFAGMPGWEDYMRAADSYLSCRTLYASSYPNCPIVAYKRWFEALPLKPDNLERILYRNASELLGL